MSEPPEHAPSGSATGLSFHKKGTKRSAVEQKLGVQGNFLSIFRGRTSAPYRPHSQSKMATFFLNTMFDFPN